MPNAGPIGRSGIFPVLHAQLFEVKATATLAPKCLKRECAGCSYLRTGFLVISVITLGFGVSFAHVFSCLGLAIIFGSGTMIGL